MLIFQKCSEDKSVFSEPRYLDTGSMFDHAERLNLIFTLFTGEIVIHVRDLYKVRNFFFWLA